MRRFLLLILHSNSRTFERNLHSYTFLQASLPLLRFSFQHERQIQIAHGGGFDQGTRVAQR